MHTMIKDKTLRDLAIFDTLLHKVVNKLKRIEKKPRYFGTDDLIYPSEIHTIEALGRHPGINVTELAAIQGITKGGVSQLIQKLEAKKMVIKMKNVASDREVYLKLTEKGMIAYKGHEDFHSRILPDLLYVIEEATPDQLAYVEKLFTTIERFCDKILEEKT